MPTGHLMTESVIMYINIIFVCVLSARLLHTAVTDQASMAEDDEVEQSSLTGGNILVHTLYMKKRM